jgi:hypothetical protein
LLIGVLVVGSVGHPGRRSPVCRGPHSLSLSCPISCPHLHPHPHPTVIVGPLIIIFHGVRSLVSSSVLVLPIVGFIRCLCRSIGPTIPAVVLSSSSVHSRAGCLSILILTLSLSPSLSSLSSGPPRSCVPVPLSQCRRHSSRTPASSSSSSPCWPVVVVVAAPCCCCCCHCSPLQLVGAGHPPHPCAHPCHIIAPCFYPTSSCSWR